MKMSQLSQTSVKLPVLDISQPIHPSTLSSVYQACKDWGFFHIINHGISEELYNKLHSLCSQAFALPLDFKLKIGPASPINTYTPPFIASPFFESLKVSGPNYFSSAKSSADVLFDRQSAEFSHILQEYGAKMMELSEKVVKILLKCLGDDFEAKFYEDEFSKCHGYLRINNYMPPENIIKEEEEDIQGLGMHTDMSCITILYQDEVGGLQVRSKKGKWMDVDPCEGTLVVNIGDLLQAWSNGWLRSSEHRVVLKQPVTRFSMAFFWSFENEKVVLAPKEVVGKENKRNYRPFVCSDYVKFREKIEGGSFEGVGFTVDHFASASTI